MRRVSACILAAALLSACGGGSHEPTGRQAELYMQGLDGRGVVLRAGTDVNRVYAEASALKDKGDCTGAIPKLGQVASLGPGYENAQTALGECLLQKARGSDLSADYLEGLMWLRRAADAGWPEAQLRLAASHALGPIAIRNADEAAYWLALYQTNTGKMRVSFVPPSPQDLAAIERAIPDAAKKSGSARATTWERHVWIPPAPPPGPGPTGRARRGAAANDQYNQGDGQRDR